MVNFITSKDHDPSAKAVHWSDDKCAPLLIAIDNRLKDELATNADQTARPSSSMMRTSTQKTTANQVSSRRITGFEELPPPNRPPR